MATQTLTVDGYPTGTIVTLIKSDGTFQDFELEPGGGGGGPTGPAGGDLTGTYPDPTVQSISSAIAGQVPIANPIAVSTLTGATASSGDIRGTSTMLVQTRNTANTGDLTAFEFDGGDRLQVGDPDLAGLSVYSGTDIDMTGGAPNGLLNTTALDFISHAELNAAGTGAIRMNCDGRGGISGNLTTTDPSGFVTLELAKCRVVDGVIQLSDNSAATELAGSFIIVPSLASVVAPGQLVGAMAGTGILVPFGPPREYVVDNPASPFTLPVDDFGNLPGVVNVEFWGGGGGGGGGAGGSAAPGFAAPGGGGGGGALRYTASLVPQAGDTQLNIGYGAGGGPGTGGVPGGFGAPGGQGQQTIVQLNTSLQQIVAPGGSGGAAPQSSAAANVFIPGGSPVTALDGNAWATAPYICSQMAIGATVNLAVSGPGVGGVGGSLVQFPPDAASSQAAGPGGDNINGISGTPGEPGVTGLTSNPGGGGGAGGAGGGYGDPVTGHAGGSGGKGGQADAGGAGAGNGQPGTVPSVIGAGDGGGGGGGGGSDVATPGAGGEGLNGESGGVRLRFFL